MSLPHTVEAFPKIPLGHISKLYSEHTQNSQPLNKNVISNATPTNEDRSFITLSEEGKRLSKQSNAEKELINRETTLQQATPNQERTTQDKTQNQNLLHQKNIQNQLTPKQTENQMFTDEEQKEIDHLKRRDLEVKTHERAHASIGGRFAGAPNYQYETGPNGTRYATDGEVSIDLTEITNNPKATIDKMKQVYRAALAPSEPSSEDRSIASQAQQTITTARTDISNKDSSNKENPEEDQKSYQNRFIQTPQEKQNINTYKQADNSSTNTLYQLA